MNKRFAIFDMDGTLVDSMGYWGGLAAEFLRRYGFQTPPDGIMERIAPLTVAESAALFVRELGIPGTPQEAEAEMNAMMAEHYRRDVPLKPGVDLYLAGLAWRGTRMCVASSTAEPLMEACLSRLGVRERFEFLLSCDSVGAGKHRPDVYDAAAKRLGAEQAADVAVYEDAIYAARTAKAAGYAVVGVYDAAAADEWEAIRRLADETILDWETALQLL